MIRLFVLAIIVATVGFVIYQMISFLVAINSTKSQKKRDAEKLRAALLDKKNHLVKLSDDELELLSINITDTSAVPGLNPEKYGVFTSIYHEPLISFARKVYGAGNESVTVVITSQHEFVYHSAASVF